MRQDSFRKGPNTGDSVYAQVAPVAEVRVTEKMRQKQPFDLIRAELFVWQRLLIGVRGQSEWQELAQLRHKQSKSNVRVWMQSGLARQIHLQTRLVCEIKSDRRALLKRCTPLPTSLTFFDIAAEFVPACHQALASRFARRDAPRNLRAHKALRGILRI